MRRLSCVGAADGFGNFYLAGDDFAIRKVHSQGTITRVAQGVGPITVDASGNLYYFLTDGTVHRLRPGARSAAS